MFMMSLNVYFPVDSDTSVDIDTGRVDIETGRVDIDSGRPDSGLRLRR